MQRKVVAALSAGCLVVAIALAFLHFRAHASASRGRTWPQRLATIERSEAPVTYRYEDGGRTLRASDAKATAGRYRVGQRVIAYVNPANPAEALLEFHRQPGMALLVSAGFALLFALGFGVYALLHTFAPGIVNRRSNASARKPAPAPRKAAPMSRLRPPPAIPRPRPQEEEKPEEHHGEQK